MSQKTLRQWSETQDGRQFGEQAAGVVVPITFVEQFILEASLLTRKELLGHQPSMYVGCMVQGIEVSFQHLLTRTTGRRNLHRETVDL